MERNGKRAPSVFDLVDPLLLIIIVVGVVVCGLAMSRPSSDPGSGDYTGWDFDNDGDG